jgi:hypothetical protein
MRGARTHKVGIKQARPINDNGDATDATDSSTDATVIDTAAIVSDCSGSGSS